MQVLLTGASGFVGQAVAAQLLAEGEHQLRAAYRQLPVQVTEGEEACLAPDLTADANWSSALADVDVVIHCAARVHVMQEQARDPLAEFRRVNVAGTLALAEQAQAQGVRRFIYVSSIKVCGEATEAGQAFTADGPAQAEDPYGISKLEAEQALLELAQRSGLEVVIVRPPLVYGPGVKANFLAMMRWLSKGVPLPFGAIHNARSLVYVGNLADLLVRCIDHPAAAGQRFLVSDGEDLSTSILLRKLAAALGRPARLLAIPQSWIVLLATLVGRKNLSQRLCGSLQVNIDKTCERLGWQPPYTVEQALQRTASAYIESAKS